MGMGRRWVQGPVQEKKRKIQASEKKWLPILTELFWVLTRDLRLERERERETKSEDGKVGGVAGSDDFRRYLRCLLHRWQMRSLQCRRGILSSSSSPSLFSSTSIWSYSYAIWFNSQIVLQEELEYGLSNVRINSFCNYTKKFGGY